MEEGNVGYSRAYSNRMSVAERWKASAAQLVYSPTARFYYWFMCVLTLFEMGVTLVDPYHSPETSWFLCLELFMVAMLLSEVALRILADGPVAFFRSSSSLFDLAVAAVCLWVAVFLLLAPSLLHRVQRWVPVTILRIRDSLRLLRLVFLIKNSRKSQQLQGSIMQLRLDEHDADDHALHFVQLDSPGSHAMDAHDLGVAFKDTPLFGPLATGTELVSPTTSPPNSFSETAPGTLSLSPLLGPKSSSPPRPLGSAPGLRPVNSNLNGAR